MVTPQSPEVQHVLDKAHGTDYSRQARNILIAVIAGAVVVVVVFAIMGAVLIGVTGRNTTASRAADASASAARASIEAQRVTVARTECVRNLTNDVNDKRWGAIATIFKAAAAGSPAGERAGVATLVGTSGETAKQIAKKCPGPIAPPSSPNAPVTPQETSP